MKILRERLLLPSSKTGGNSPSNNTSVKKRCGRGMFRPMNILVLLVAVRFIYSVYLDKSVQLWKQSETTDKETGSSSSTVTTFTTTLPSSNNNGDDDKQRDKDDVTGATGRQAEVCNIKSRPPLYSNLCKTPFIRDADAILKQQNLPLNVVQIGAHTGFEKNDPLAKIMGAYLELLSITEKQRVTWTFVEPSPPNYQHLVQNLQNHSDFCQMKAVNAAVVSDSLQEEEILTMTFYSISDAIDTETGYDSKSGKQLPFWVTQIGSFSEQHIRKHGWVWKKENLTVADYIVETNVTALRYSNLMQGHVDETQPPLFVLIDTEGFDCKIVLGMSNTSAYLPQYLLYEHVHCAKGEKEMAVAHLQNMDYAVVADIGGGDAFAYRKL
ncbi:MAG: hypothetical protein SGILL_008734 [Bacillariaceae sp.]